MPDANTIKTTDVVMSEDEEKVKVAEQSFTEVPANEASQPPAEEAQPLIEEAVIDKAKAKVCGVCEEKEGKYKCSRCFLPYCSIACSKKHIATHPPLEPTPTIEKDTAPAPPPKIAPRLGTRAAAGFRGPFAALDDSKELQELFKIYPLLRAQLEGINTATLCPLEEQNYNQEYSRKRNGIEPWNSDRGLQKGVEALTQARNTSGKEGEGIREFSRLILQILSGENGDEAAAVIEREIAEENARLIEQLQKLER
ncbi:hypothetical protein LSUE1_G000130 [Lachnellula suecica]|uniref:HIT-type domain-containing protein n=1 Tax=Lachnellula suecica TaxID=602035 RepID=A0A8T9CHZ7_9HELO|nr:hypothetical protein LSUE1_G000130 [Lachnellula suecica]